MMVVMGSPSSSMLTLWWSRARSSPLSEECSPIYSKRHRKTRHISPSKRICLSSIRYPVILNIENHCSLEQQRQMARILKNIFGGRSVTSDYDWLPTLSNQDYLVTKPITTKDPSVLPSPEDLKYKVLIRVSESGWAVHWRHLIQ